MELPLGSIAAIKMVLFNLFIRKLGKKASEIKSAKHDFTVTVTACFLVFKLSACCSNWEIHGGIWGFIKFNEFRKNLKKFQNKTVKIKW